MKKLALALSTVGLLGICSAQVASAEVVYDNDFESNSTADLSGGSIAMAPNGQNYYMLGHGVTGTLSLNGIAAHTDVTLTFDLYAIGSLDGNGQQGGGPDPFTVTFQSDNIINTNVANYAGGNTQEFPNINGTGGYDPDTGAISVDTLGYTGFPGTIQDSIESLSSTNSDTSSTLVFTFVDGSNEGNSNEFYGIDNLFVSTDAIVTRNVPEPFTLSLFGAGLVGAAAMRRRKKAKQA